jgi:flagellar basal-body rod protein FlgC
MSMLKILDVASSAVSAQSQRLNVVASNLANADTVAGPTARPTRRARWCSRPP